MSENEKRQERMSIPSLTCGTQKLGRGGGWQRELTRRVSWTLSRGKQLMMQEKEVWF